MNKVIQLRNIQHPIVGRANYNADIRVGHSIRIFGTQAYGTNPDFDKTFQIGDLFVSGSYNLIYTDTIVGVTAKNVIYRDGSGTKRMPIAKFIWRNADFDLARIRQHNTIESMNI